MNVEVLKERARIVSAIRKFFDDQGFVEVETAVRIAAPAPEEHIDCPPVVGGGYLRASPELQMKKLLAAGMDRIYQIGPCFREGEKGSRHNPEFTMLEWYRRGANYLDIKRDLERLLADLVVVVQRKTKILISAVRLRLPTTTYCVFAMPIANTQAGIPGRSGIRIGLISIWRRRSSRQLSPSVAECFSWTIRLKRPHWQKYQKPPTH